MVKNDYAYVHHMRDVKVGVGCANCGNLMSLVRQPVGTAYWHCDKCGKNSPACFLLPGDG